MTLAEAFVSAFPVCCYQISRGRGLAVFHQDHGGHHH